MKDRELVEMAARAIGRKVERVACDANNFGGLFFEDHGSDDYAWNPLEDDGEALRLAMDLKINIHYENQYVDVVRHTNEHSYLRLSEYFTLATDRHSATRRAIVRAAAEIGKAMP